MPTYYNEFDGGKADWLRELMKAGAISAGDVDERSIKDVTANDLCGVKYGVRVLMAYSSYDQEADGMLGTKPMSFPATSNSSFYAVLPAAHVRVYELFLLRGTLHRLRNALERLGSADKIARLNYPAVFFRAFFAGRSTPWLVSACEILEPIWRSPHAYILRSISICSLVRDRVQYVFRTLGNHVLVLTFRRHAFCETEPYISQSTILRRSGLTELKIRRTSSSCH